MNVSHNFANNLSGYSDEELAMALESQLAAVRVAVKKPVPSVSEVVSEIVRESDEPFPEASFSTMSDAVIVLPLRAQLEMGHSVVAPVAQRDVTGLIVAHHEESETSIAATEPVVSVESFLASESLAAENPFSAEEPFAAQVVALAELPPRVSEPSFDDLIFGNLPEG